MQASESGRFLIPGIDFVIPRIRPTTKLEIQACFRWLRLSEGDSLSERTEWNHSDGITAHICCKYRRELVDRVPFTLVGNAGWLGVRLLTVGQQPHSFYLLVSAFDNDGSSQQFEIFLEVLFDFVRRIESIGPVPDWVSRRFELELDRQLVYSLADWRDRAELCLENARMSDLERLHTEVNAIENRLASITKELPQLRFPSSQGAQPQPAPAEYLKCKEEQASLRATLLDMERKEAQLHEQQSRLTSAMNPMPDDYSTMTLFTLRWTADPFSPVHR